MVDRNNVCKACEGTGMLADDEEWQYTCTVCGGDGHLYPGDNTEPSNLINVDENNRILD
jgi:DnaJ-class molecular chaperone